MARSMLHAVRIRNVRAGLADEVRSAEATFDEAKDLALLEAGGQISPEVQRLIDSVEAGFKKLTEEAERATSKAHAEKIRDRAQGLARRRVYVYPVAELALQAHSAYQELETWRVPAEVLGSVSAGVERIGQENTPEPDKRGALRLILEAYDYWDWYVDWSAVRATLAAVALGLITVVSLTMGARALFAGSILVGFLTAGAAGASLSVLLRLPPIDVYGAIAQFWVQGVARIITGMVASAVGLALLSSGIINFSIGSGADTVPLSVVLSQCQQIRPPDGAEKAPARTGAQTPTATGSPTATAAPSAAQTTTLVATSAATPAAKAAAPTAETGVGQTASPVPAGSASADTRSKVDGSGEENRKPPCSSGSILFLLGLAIVFGFSERMLATFEESILGRVKPSGSPRTGGDAKPPSQG